jgi:hypothetical protein
MKRDQQMPAPLEKEIKIILTSIKRGYHAVNLRSSAFICGLFLICASEYNYFLRIIKTGLKGKHSRGFLRLFNFSWNKELLHSFSTTEYTESTERCSFSLFPLCSLWFFKPEDNKKSRRLSN